MFTLEGAPDNAAFVPPPLKVIVGEINAPVSVLQITQSVVSLYISPPERVGIDTLPEPSVVLLSRRSTVYETSDILWILGYLWLNKSLFWDLNLRVASLFSRIGLAYCVLPKPIERASLKS